MAIGRVRFVRSNPVRPEVVPRAAVGYTHTVDVGGVYGRCRTSKGVGHPFLVPGNSAAHRLPPQSEGRDGHRVARAAGRSLAQSVSRLRIRGEAGWTLQGRVARHVDAGHACEPVGRVEAEECEVGEPVEATVHLNRYPRRV